MPENPTKSVASAVNRNLFPRHERAVSLLLAGCVLLLNPVLNSVRAAHPIIESAALRLEMDARPFSFRVIEKSTGAVLLAQTNNQFMVGGAAHAVVAAKNVRATGWFMEADLVLADTSAAAHVRFTFPQPEILRVALSGGDGTSQILQQFADQGEYIYGGWEYPFNGTLHSRGTDKPNLGFTTQPNINCTSARAPFYLTSKHYAVYVESEAQGRFMLAIGGKTGFSFNAPRLTFDIIYGPDYAGMMARYNALAGPSMMPVTWAFDSIWWKDDDHDDLHNATNAQGNVLDTAIQLQNNRIPASAIWIDHPFGTPRKGQGWGNFDFDNSFPDPAGMVRDLQGRGINLMIWTANRCWLDGNFLHTNGAALGYQFPGIPTWTGPAIDLRIPAAYDWFKSRLDIYARLGIKGWKIDRGEEGEQPDSVQNENVNLFLKLSAESLAAIHPNDNFVFARCIYDTGRRHAAVWNGDTHGTFDGLRYSVLSGLRSAMMNFPMWGSDTGGYLSAPTEELFARWFQFSAYSPMMETVVGNHRTPWYDYSSNLVAVARAQAAAHHDLMPYARSCVYQATQTGMPLMRPMIFACPQDTNAANMGDEYLFGPNLLVAPVLTAGATNRSVYLPSGAWLDYNARSNIITGPATVTAAAPLDTIPLFVSEGAIIPRGDIWKGNNNWTPNWSPQLRIEFFPSDKVDGKFPYYTGKSVQTITCSSRKNVRTIRFGDLGVSGDLEIYVKQPSRVIRNGVKLAAGKDFTYDSGRNLLRVSFAGATTVSVENGASLFRFQP